MFLSSSPALRTASSTSSSTERTRAASAAVSVVAPQEGSSDRAGARIRSKRAHLLKVYSGFIRVPGAVKTLDLRKCYGHPQMQRRKFKGQNELPPTSKTACTRERAGGALSASVGVLGPPSAPPEARSFSLSAAMSVLMTCGGAESRRSERRQQRAPQQVKKLMR